MMWWTTVVVVVVIGGLTQRGQSRSTWDARDRVGFININHDIPKQHPVDDDCVHCFNRVKELETRIQVLESNIQEMLQERHDDDVDRLTASTHSTGVDVRKKRDVTGVGSGVGGDGGGCTPYSDYNESGQCSICGGGGGPSAEWTELCDGDCLAQITQSCSFFGDLGYDAYDLCLNGTICIDCSNAAAMSKTRLVQVPCPPDGYGSYNTSNVFLRLDNNHHLNLTGAFGIDNGVENVYPHLVAGISLSNTTLDGLQFNFKDMSIQGNMNMSFATVLNGLTDNAFMGTRIFGDFDMHSATIFGGILNSVFHSSAILGAFNMSSAMIVGDITAAAFESANVQNDFDMSYSNMTGGISGGAFSDIRFNSGFIMRSATIAGGIENYAFGAAFVSSDFDMSFASITGGITNDAFQSANIGGNFIMYNANLLHGIGSGAFHRVIIDGNLDMSMVTIPGGITDFAFSNAGIGGDVLFVGTMFGGVGGLGGVGVRPGVFLASSVLGVFNASHATFPNNILPIQMLYGLEAQKGLDFSYCNLEHLEEKPCESGGCFSFFQNTGVDIQNTPTLAQGGPFTGMAMPVGIAFVRVNLSHNHLTTIGASALMGITATTLDLSSNNISEYHPYWFVGVPNANTIITGGNPSTCQRNQVNSTIEESYTYQQPASVQCTCAVGTYGTGNFCSKQKCTATLASLNIYSRKFLGGGTYTTSTPTTLTPTPTSDVTPTTSELPSGEYVTFQCPQGMHPNNKSALTAQCLGGAFQPQTNQCVNNAKPSWFTAGRIVGIVFGVLAIAAIIGYFFLLSPEKRKGKRLANELGISTNEVELNERLLHETNCDLEEATVLNTRMRGAWKIEESDVDIGVVLASGAFGVVHDGMFAGLRVAIKVLKQPLDEENYPDVGKDFTRECETLMAIRHACLLIFYGAGLTSENRPFMVTEFMSKGSLRKVLADKSQKLPWPIRHKFSLQIAKAMEYLHALGIVHRDLKSDNCLINDQLDVKVCDFGTSKFLTAGRSSLQQSMIGVEESMIDGEGSQTDSVALSVTMTKGVGTALWMAPELFVGGTKYKQEVDMYSFGVIMWELVTREQPWDEIKDSTFIGFFAALSSALANNQRPQIPVVVEEQSAFVALMKICWVTDPHSRPTFAHVVKTLSLE
eukprot:m.199369 g.199369  ORF g.199369 m.199369 type:complete len:1145 (-) comp32730_c0_seq7:213-3647(-)